MCKVQEPANDDARLDHVRDMRDSGVRASPVEPDADPKSQKYGE
jgi:hypothetical protein